MASFFQRLFGRKKNKKQLPSEGVEGFAARFNRFRLFLSASLDAYSEMMALEERLAEERPFGMPFLRVCMARLTAASLQCMLQLNVLAKNRFTKLHDPFNRLRSEVQAVLEKGTVPVHGPLLIPYASVSQAHHSLLSPNLCKLEAIRREHPEFLPRGFVVTGAAWWLYYDDPDMHDEIDRIMVISQEDPASYGEAGARIRERLAASYPLPGPLVDQVLQALAGYPELDMPGFSLLIRCFPMLSEHGALTIPEQVLHTPVDAQGVIQAIQSSLTMTYRPRAIVYRLKRGIRDRAMPMCISLTLIPEVHARGSAHRKLESLNPDEPLIHVRRGFTPAPDIPLQASDETAFLPPMVYSRIRDQADAALASLADAPIRGKRHEIFWAASATGRLYILGVNALPNPACLRPEKSEQRTVDKQAAILLGGLSTYPGLVEGQVFPVRNFQDALHFPLGGILLLQQASPRWSFLLDFAAGAVAGDGTGHGLFARTARRYGKPTILGQPDAFTALCTGQQVRLRASADRVPCIEPVSRPDEPDEKGLAEGDAPAVFGHGPLWLLDGSVPRMAREIAPKVVPLTLPDSEDIDFRADNCRTFRDILNYCHVKAVREMYRAGTSSKSSSAPAKQLVCDVPKQFWIINLDDGFDGPVAGPLVRLEQIVSLPLRMLWEGFVYKPWEGPPQINAKGFLSVLFEASANPSLDPASQSSQYTEKNVFLIARRFCSMRCRFGFHFLSLDCLVGERERERFIVFQFKGGAANRSRRVRRVQFVAELLSQFDFAAEIIDDALTARLETGTEHDFLMALKILGYLTMHTRQLDMIMGDESALALKRGLMLRDMNSLHSTRSRFFPD